MNALEKVDVLVIGAGPSGAIAAALLVKRGYNVRVLERETFPRFSIGESLLPHCMEFVEEAGMLAAVHAAGFQYKNGAAFSRAGAYTEIDFRNKFSKGWGTTYQVERAAFDKILADEAERMGADVRYQHEITAVDISGDNPVVTYNDADGVSQQLEAKFLLDASGFGRVLPRLLDLHVPSNFPVRQAIFTHIVDNIDCPNFDRNKILITVHPTDRDVWYWLIPFGDGRCSVGVVAEQSYFEQFDGEPEDKLKHILTMDQRLKELLVNAEFKFPFRMITGYSANVKSLHGKGFALLGNAGEFLDPVFSSGVTIAMRSSSMAAALLDRQFQGESVDWQTEFAEPLKKGVDTFRTFVTAWYDQRFQDVIFHENKSEEVLRMIAAILAGYAWDEKNPYVADSERRLNVLVDLCRAQ
jgi:flavin-dependent dehydrogenase